MQRRDSDTLFSLINKIRDAEIRLERLNGDEDLQLAYCDGIQSSLDILKNENFEKTEFYKKIEKRLNDYKRCLERKAGYILMENGNDIISLWYEFDKIFESCKTKLSLK
jgi:tRNA G10  N-methylase Trm11